MDIAPALPDPSRAALANDRIRLHHAILGSLLLVTGIWIVWLAGWLLGWPPGDFGVLPRQLDGLVGIALAPLAHGSFEHLMSNTLPLGMLTCLALYAYPLATRWALPAVWLGSGLGVWLFARDSSHIGASGVTHGLMFFLFTIGVLRRDRLAIVISMTVFFLYGGMLLTVLPREERISFEYHMAGAVMGILAAIVLRRRDPVPPRKRYSWEEESEDAGSDQELELPRPGDVPILWKRSPVPEGARIIAFPADRARLPAREEEREEEDSVR